MVEPSPQITSLGRLYEACLRLRACLVHLLGGACLDLEFSQRAGADFLQGASTSKPEPSARQT